MLLNLSSISYLIGGESFDLNHGLIQFCNEWNHYLIQVVFDGSVDHKLFDGCLGLLVKGILEPIGFIHQVL